MFADSPLYEEVFSLAQYRAGKMETLRSVISRKITTPYLLAHSTAGLKVNVYIALAY